MPRTVLTRWIVLLLVVIAAFAATAVALNSTVFSASGFVSSYLGALARHDVEGALRTNGVTVPSGISRALLTANALGQLSDIRLVSDTDDGAGVHTVTYSYAFGSDTGTTAFRVRHEGSRFGVFSAWAFADSPVSELDVTPLHASTFDANSVAFTATNGAGTPTPVAVLAPAAVTLSHRSTYLAAAKKVTVVQKAGGRTSAEVDIRASSAFVAEVQKELNAHLDSCVTQKVLLPTGCPMGTQIADRIQDAPTWSMVRYPIVSIVPGATAATWAVPETTATAHLKVGVRSIFDGSLSTFDRDVPFTVKYTITFQSDGSLLIVEDG